MESSSGQQSEEDTYDSQEQQKLCLMRTFVGSHDPSAKVSAKDTDDLTLKRFLRARELDIEKGGMMFLKYLKWRREFVPRGNVSEADIKNELAQNKAFMQGHDRKGCPILVLFGRHHFPRNPDDFKRLIVYSFDKLCSRLPAGEEQFLIIGDLEGWGYANSDIRGYLGAISILQDYYPERLRMMMLIHVPRIFMAVWKIMYPFIDNRTREKFVFVNNNTLKTALLQQIEESQLPDIYGGKTPLQPVQQS